MHTVNIIIVKEDWPESGVCCFQKRNDILLIVSNVCFVILFAVNALVFGKLAVSPPGPIIVNIGTAVLINCSTDEHLQPNIRWLRPYFMSSALRLKDVVAHNETMVPREEGRIRYRWSNRSVLQLVISSAAEQDSGTYWCLLNESVYRAVVLVVTNSSLLHQNTPAG